MEYHTGFHWNILVCSMWTSFSFSEGGVRYNISSKKEIDLNNDTKFLPKEK